MDLCPPTRRIRPVKTHIVCLHTIKTGQHRQTPKKRLDCAALIPTVPQILCVRSLYRLYHLLCCTWVHSVILSLCHPLLHSVIHCHAVPLTFTGSLCCCILLAVAHSPSLPQSILKPVASLLSHCFLFPRDGVAVGAQMQAPIDAASSARHTFMKHPQIP